MRNYRKAKRNEIRCKDCHFVISPNPGNLKIPGFPKERFRCGVSYTRISYAVGKNMTCDCAKQKK